MIGRFAWGLVGLGLVLGCSESDAPEDTGLHAGAGGTTHAAGASGSSGAGEHAGRDDQSPAGAGGVGGEDEVGGQAGEGGMGGAVATNFWGEATERIMIDCFGFFAGYAAFRADRSQLSAEQLELLANELGVPGSTYNTSDDAIHCVVTATEAGKNRKFTIDESSALITHETLLGEGGAAGNPVGTEWTVLGCEFHDPWPQGDDAPPFRANPLCLHEIEAESMENSYRLDLAIPGRPYHVEFVYCGPDLIKDTTVALFGADAETPLAIGRVPTDPGPDHACFVLDAEVETKIVGRLQLSSPSRFGPGDFAMIFR